MSISLSTRMRLLLLLVVVLGQCQAQLSPDDAMAQARDAAAAKGINPVSTGSRAEQKGRGR